jgi:predicted transposase YbfD/YdcC
MLDFNAQSILPFLESITDPRIERTKKHLLTDILTITICAVICGAEGWEDIEIYAEANEKWFQTFLELPNGIPSHDTLARVFAKLSPKEFQTAFQAWIDLVQQGAPRQVLAIDGKTLRHSFDRAAEKSAIHMVSAWAASSGLVFGQVKVTDKSNEITAIPKLLEVIDVKGNIVTIDAMGCQKEIASSVTEKEGDFVLSLKGNQGNLHEGVKLAFDTVNLTSLEETTTHFFKTVDADHGRIETRECYLMSALNHLELIEGWSGIKSFGMVVSTREIGDKSTSETRYFITSLYSNAEEFGKSVRQHWGIENSLHWVLDVTFREDDCRIRKDNAAENFAIVRHIALNLAKSEKTHKRGIRAKRLLAGWDRDYLLKVFAGPKI